MKNNTPGKLVIVARSNGVPIILLFLSNTNSAASFPARIIKIVLPQRLMDLGGFLMAMENFPVDIAGSLVEGLSDLCNGEMAPGN